MSKLFDLPKFIKNEREIAHLLKSALMRQGRHPTWRSELRRNSAVYLYANNVNARIRASKIVYRHIGALFGMVKEGDRANTPVYHLTLTPKQFACPLRDAPDFDVRSLQAWVRHELQGFDYWGNVEAAYYSNFSISGGEPTISWHVHVLMWKTTLRAVADLEDRINEKYASILPGRPAAQKTIANRADVQKLSIYLMKSPHDYHVGKSRTETLNGTIRKQAESNKRSPSGAKELRICEFMKDRYLDGLMLAGGEGKRVLGAIRKDLLMPLEFHKRQQYIFGTQVKRKRFPRPIQGTA